MATANPAMTEAAYLRAGRAENAESVMTLQGSVLKTAILVLILLGTGVFTWNQTVTNPPVAQGLMIAGLIGGLILALITIFRPQASPFTAPLYAAAEGLAMGAISAAYESLYNGIVMQAIVLTVGVLAIMLALYGTGIIRATEKFKIGIIAATGAIALLYIVSMVLSLFHVQVPFIFGNGAIGIGFSVVVVVIAALNLVLDFDFIDKGVQRQAPRYMEWYGGFSLLVTLVWMYLEILRLLAKLQDRRS
jgi:uncharacterized YccA/Bax inhibitor family protein